MLRHNAPPLWPSRQADRLLCNAPDVAIARTGVHARSAVPVRQMCTLPSQAPLQKALPLGLGATSSTASVCPLYIARQVGGCTAPDEVAFNAGAAHKRMLWSLPADKASAPCEEGRQLTALMPCLCACVLLISSPAPVGNEVVQQTIMIQQTCCCSIGKS